MNTGIIFALFLIMVTSNLAVLQNNQYAYHIGWIHQQTQKFKFINALNFSQRIDVFIQNNNMRLQQYFIAENLTYVEYKSSNQQFIFRANQSQAMIYYNISDKIQIRINENLAIEFSAQSHAKFLKLSQICEFNIRDHNFLCPSSGTLRINEPTSNFSTHKKLIQEKLTSVSQKLKLSHQQYFSLMVTQTLSTLCLVNGQLSNSKFIGLCDQGEFQLRYSLLILELLMTIDTELGCWLIDNYLSYAEEKMLYPIAYKKEWIPIPEHIVTIEKYILHTQQLLGSNLLKNNRKVVATLNAYINQMLLSDVNHIEEQINYRQLKVLHPTIIKMLTLKWKTNSSKNLANSIYYESFTPDFCYHHPQNQQLQNSIGKMAWLVQVCSVYANIVLKVGTPLEINALEQVSSLLSIIQKYKNSYIKSKQKIPFYSIVDIGMSKFYSKSLGYQSLLPYIYKLDSHFPQQALSMLSTSYGLASLQNDSQYRNQKHQFRGNIHLYFNYKLLFGLLQRLKEGKKTNIQETNTIVKILNDVKKLLQLQMQIKNTCTSWNSIGKCKNNLLYLSLLKIFIFREDLF